MRAGGQRLRTAGIPVLNEFLTCAIIQLNQYVVCLTKVIENKEQEQD